MRNKNEDTEFADLPDFTVKGKWSFGTALEWIRKNRGWTQLELAGKVGMDQTTVSQIERGEIKHSRKIKGIAKVLNVDPAWLQYGHKSLENLTSRGIDLALRFENMSEPDKKAVEGIVKRFK